MSYDINSFTTGTRKYPQETLGNTLKPQETYLFILHSVGKPTERYCIFLYKTSEPQHGHLVNWGAEIERQSKGCEMVV